MWEHLREFVSCSGGLGIGNLTSRNLGLWAECGWRFMIEKGSLSKDITVSKHSFKMGEWVPESKAHEAGDH